MDVVDNVQFTEFVDNLEKIASNDLKAAREYVDRFPVKHNIQRMIWCMKYKPEAADFLYECISSIYTPIIIKVNDGYVALIDYSNPWFDKYVEGTCHIEVFDSDGNGLNCYRLVYKLTENRDLKQLVEDCLEFAEMKTDTFEIAEGFGSKLFEDNTSKMGVASNVF